MENKVQNTILIGDENDNNQNDNDNNEDIFEAIFNEIKENFKSVDEEELKKEEENKSDKNKAESEKEKEKEENKYDDFVIIEKNSKEDDDKNDF